MGIIGLGSIGLAVAERAAAFGIEVRSLARKGRSSYVETRAEELGITMCDSMGELLSSSDIVSLHVPSNADTRRMVDADFLEQLRPGAILLNTSRGDVVDEEALLEALDAGRLRAGLDVFADEPGSSKGKWDSPLGRHRERRRHPPHRRLDRAGAAGHRRRDHRDHRRVHGRARRGTA